MRNLSAFWVIIILGSACSARADLTIVQEIERPQKLEETVKIKGDKERTDTIPEGTTDIIDGKAGEWISLKHVRIFRHQGKFKKWFTRVTADQLRAERAKMPDDAYLNANPPSAKSFTPSGKTDTINGYQVEEFIYQTPTFRLSFWVARKYPDAAAILKEMQAPFSGAWKASFMSMPRNYTDLPGVPLRTVVFIPGYTSVTWVTTVKSIKRDPISSHEFEIPKDFRELKGPSPASSASATP
jgi:Domain of unknown function (DUF4412)